MVTLTNEPLRYDRHGQAKKHVAQMTDDEIEAVARACVPYMKGVPKCPHYGYYGLYGRSDDVKRYNSSRTNAVMRRNEANYEKGQADRGLEGMTHVLNRMDERDLGNPRELDDEVFRMLYGARETLVNASTGRRGDEMRVLLRSPETKMGHLKGIEEEQPVNLCMVYSVTDRAIVTMWHSHKDDKHLDVSSDAYNEHLDVDHLSRIRGSRFHRGAQGFASGRFEDAYMGYLPHDKERAKGWRDYGLEHSDKGANPWRQAAFDNPFPVPPQYHEELARQQEQDNLSPQNIARQVDAQILADAKREYKGRESEGHGLSFGV